tara:strand:- start:136 stop:312 length:177 start_codon:yes stop_codon:yes gene_type:complete
MNTTNQKKIASYAILNALERILILDDLDKESVFDEYKEWIINDYKKEPILFIQEDPNI